MKLSLYFYPILLGCALHFAPSRCNGIVETIRPYNPNQSIVQYSLDKSPARRVNSIHEDALVLDAMVEALLKYPALRAKLPDSSQASKMIVAVSESRGGFLPTALTKYSEHPAAIFMDDQFYNQVPEEVLNDLDRRNADATSWSHYKPQSSNTVVMVNDQLSKTVHEFDEPPLFWYQNNPDFAGLITPSLPGYSRRKTVAVVRFLYTPVVHLCLGSCQLVKVHRKWIVYKIEITDIL